MARIYRINCLLDEFREENGNMDVITIRLHKDALEVKYHDSGDGNKVKSWFRGYRVGAN